MFEIIFPSSKYTSLQIYDLHLRIIKKIKMSQKVSLFLPGLFSILIGLGTVFLARSIECWELFWKTPSALREKHPRHPAPAPGSMCRGMLVRRWCPPGLIIEGKIPMKAPRRASNEVVCHIFSTLNPQGFQIIHKQLSWLFVCLF